MKKYFFILLIFFLFFACSKEEEVEDQISFLPVKVVSEGTVSTIDVEYNYDNNNRLIRVAKAETYTVSDLRDEIVLDIIYDNYLDKISRVITTTKIGGVLYSSNSKIEFRDTTDFNYNGATVLIGDDIIEINSKNQILNFCKQDKEKNKILTRKFRYDLLGNLTEVILFDKDASTSVMTYDYDQYNGMFKDVKTPQWFLVTQLDERLNLVSNNIRETLVQSNREPIITSRIYTYNDDGYPIDEKVYYSGYSLAVDVKPISIEYKKVVK